MLTIHSPKFSTGKTQITKQSPTFRHRRAPSVQDNYTLESKSRASADSPAKLSEGKKPKKSKSQLVPHHPTVMSKPSKDKGERQLYDSIKTLKQEYKTLKEAYKQLIQQRLKNRDLISAIRTQNSHLANQNQRLHRQSERTKLQMSFLQQENDRTRRQFLKLLEVEKFKAQKLQESLVQKQQYINQTLYKIRTEGDETISYSKINNLSQVHHDDVSLTISQDKSAVMHDHSMNNQSQFLSFSLTSVLEESTDKEPSTSKRKHEHSRVASDLTHVVVEEEKKKDLPSFRKPAKKEVPRLELNSIESRTQLIPTLIHPKQTQKKILKPKQSKSYRDKENRQTLNHNCKKKSKKVINLSNLSDY